MNDEGGWLVGHLAELGLANADGIGRAARNGRCPQCRAAVVRGLDDERCGGVATADPHEIDAIGEYLALQLGLITYSLRNSYSKKGARQWNLDPRYNWDIKAGTDAAILAQHRCGIQIPPAVSPKLAEPPRPTALPPGDGTPF